MKQINQAMFAVMAFSLLCTGLIFGADVSAADKNACSEDIAKFCQDIKPGMLALIDCLENNEDKLTSACKEYEATLLGVKLERIEQLKEKRQFRWACQEDMAKFCNDANPLAGGMLICLNDHKTEISGSCSQSLEKIMN